MQNYHRDLKALIKDTDVDIFMNVLKDKRKSTQASFLTVRLVKTTD